MAPFIAFFVSVLRAAPALESLVRQVVAQCDREREREAQQRKAEKDAAVDAWIKGGGK